MIIIFLPKLLKLIQTISRLFTNILIEGNFMEEQVIEYG